MKSRNFSYVRTRSLRHAFDVLAEHGGDAVPIAGGQSLLPGLNMRLSAPKLLVDIGELAELRGQSHDGGMVKLGAGTRHAELLASDLVRRHLPLLRQAAPHIGHVAIRNRGTLGGSLAYADPAAELPACAIALDATLVLGSASGQREVKAEDFFTGLFETDLRPGELITAVNFPVRTSSTRTAFAELSRRHGDFALAGLAVVATTEGNRVRKARVAYLGCADRAKIANSVGAAVAGRELPLQGDESLAHAVRADLSPEDTPGLRADTRLHMATVLTRRALNSLLEGNAA
jgi:aerobic carbon-monoxide dehydrogenase medium subunit